MRNKTDKAISYAYRLLSLRPRSEKELKARLFRKKIDRVTVGSVMSVLKENKAIDDLKFARLWVESRMRTSPKGDILLRKELREKGVETALIDMALSEKKEDEGSVAKALAVQAAERFEKLPMEKARKKLFDLLVRRGFAFGLVKDIVEEIYYAK